MHDPIARRNSSVRSLFTVRARASPSLCESRVHLVWTGLHGPALTDLCVIGAVIGLFSTTAGLMSLLLVCELPDYCKDGEMLDITYALRISDF